MKLIDAEDVVEQPVEKPTFLKRTTRLKPPENLTEEELAMVLKSAVASLPRFKGLRIEQLRAQVFSHDRRKDAEGEYLGVVLVDGSKFYYGLKEQRILLSQDHANRFNRRTKKAK